MTVVTGSRNCTKTSFGFWVNQVKDKAGTWIDVILKDDEMAVFLGTSAEVATAGLLKASTYRVVNRTILQHSQSFLFMLAIKQLACMHSQRDDN